jgi:hypothetical protein
LGNLAAIRYIFPHFGIFCQEKSGNPESVDGIKIQIVPCIKDNFEADGEESKLLRGTML